MKVFLLSALITLSASSLLSQTASHTFWIQFTDKYNSNYSVDRPEEYLSLRAIERRERFDIEITEQDFPISSFYVDSLQNLGLQILASSKWLNSVTAYTSDTLLIDTLDQLGFVNQVISHTGKPSQKKADSKFELDYFTKSGSLDKTDTTLLDYGYGAWQIGMVNGHILHNQGYQGQGMLIAVLDGGFGKARTNPAFDSLWMNNQIVDSWDFVTNSELSFDGHRHGSQVLSVMGSNIPGKLVGTAPKASFLLLRTENANNEKLIEEEYWVSAAEFADSAGADLINTSLGYSLFDDPLSNHTYEDMDGNTAHVTIAADIAISKGILVVTSASNLALTEWHYIAAPADGDSVLTVGAVDSTGVYASFSSTGPTFDGRIKPNLSAQGKLTAIAASDGSIMSGNGTSFSSPLICGITACLWQTNKSVHPYDIIKLLEKSASQYTTPDSLLGYGIPDYGKALFLIQGVNPVKLNENHLIRTYPNPFDNEVVVEFYSSEPQSVIVQLLSTNGQVILERGFESGLTTLNRFILSDIDNIPVGVYLIRILSPMRQHMLQVIHMN